MKNPELLNLKRTRGNRLDVIVWIYLLIYSKLIVRLVAQSVNHALMAVDRLIFTDRRRSLDAAVNNWAINLLHLQA